MQKIKVPKPPELLFTKMPAPPPKYEDSLFQEMAEDIKCSYNKQLAEIVDSLNEQLLIAHKEAESAKREAFISRILAIVAIVVSVVIGIVQIFL